jgi:hypothetical protein
MWRLISQNILNYAYINVFVPNLSLVYFPNFKTSLCAQKRFKDNNKKMVLNRMTSTEVLCSLLKTLLFSSYFFQFFSDKDCKKRIRIIMQYSSEHYYVVTHIFFPSFKRFPKNDRKFPIFNFETSITFSHKGAIKILCGTF